MSDLIEISSEFIQAVIDPNGAELTSLLDTESGIEYLWQQDPSWWKRSAPILFPIVGKLLEDRYRVGNKFYNMTQHGFARDMKFQLVRAESDSAHFKLEYTDETLKVFPYKFVLEVKFKVYGPKLIVDYEVRNVDRREMLFSIGSHPAFNVPLEKGEKFEDYFIEFDEDELGGAYYLEKGLVNFHGAPDRKMFEGRKIAMTKSLFRNDALIFKDLNSTKVSLKNINNSRSLTMEIENATYLGLWAPEGAPFVCIEPWVGVADGVDSKNDFLEKEGLISLESGKCFQTSYTLFLN
ncbi:aldose 1-epimerase family protein [Halobacteriovorax sp. HLS]|uniref:aldose 1-epimerase family protein n=1 Tax=Halobacteriovorax sp. HLS TaxID=2234000 RepID=UPI000FDA1205|nr:aldose 1-epimerase family protein [Halobacteriovorax sp. HLS]